MRSSRNSSTSRSANESAQCNSSGVQWSYLKPCDITSSTASEYRFRDWRSGTGFVGRLGRPATEISPHLLSHSALRVPRPADSFWPLALSGRTSICHTSPEMLIKVVIVLWQGFSERTRGKFVDGSFSGDGPERKGVTTAGHAAIRGADSVERWDLRGFGFLVMKRVAIRRGGWYLVASFCGRKSV